MKKLKTTKKLNLKIDILRMLQGNELRRVEGGTESNIFRCQNDPTAASGGAVCCA